MRRTYTQDMTYLSLTYEKRCSHEQFSSLTVPGLDEWTCCDNSTGKWLIHSFSPLHFLWQPALHSSYTVWPTSVWHLLVVSSHDFFKAPTHTHTLTHSREASRLFSQLVCLGNVLFAVPKDFKMLSVDLWSTPLYILPNKGLTVCIHQGQHANGQRHFCQKHAHNVS